MYQPGDPGIGGRTILVRISLLPPEIKQHQQELKKRFALILVFGVIIIILISIYSSLIIANVKAGDELAGLQLRQTELTKEIASLIKYQELVNKGEKINVIYRKAMGGVPDWEAILTGIGLIIPGEVRLTDIQMTASGEMLMKGWVYDYLFIGAWLDVVTALPEVTEVRLKNARMGNADGQVVFQFEIAAVVRSRTFALSDWR